MNSFFMVLDSGRNEGRILCQVRERASLIDRGGGPSLKGRMENEGRGCSVSQFRTRKESSVFIRSSRISGKIARRTLKKKEKKRISFPPLFPTSGEGSYSNYDCQSRVSRLFCSRLDSWLYRSKVLFSRKIEEVGYIIVDYNRFRDLPG